MAGAAKRVEAFDYVIVNRDFHLDETVDIIRAIIEAEHHRVKPRKGDSVIDSPSASTPSSQPASPQQPIRFPLPDSAPYVTYALIGVTVVFYVLQVASVILFGRPPALYSGMDWLEFFGARVNEDILAGQLWRLLTPALLYGSIPHIFFNRYALVSLGTGLERYFGRGRFLLL